MARRIKGLNDVGAVAQREAGCSTRSWLLNARQSCADAAGRLPSWPVWLAPADRGPQRKPHGQSPGVLCARGH
jgi:hypothetical protein